MDCQFRITKNFPVLMLVSLLVLLVGVPACSVTNTVRTHPEFKKIASSIKTLYVVPPEVVVTHKEFSANDRRESDQEQRMKDLISDKIPEHLTKQGITLIDSDFDQTFGDTAELTLDQLRSAYRKASNELHENKKSSWLQQDTVKTSNHKGYLVRLNNDPIVSLGSVANYISKQLSADGLLIVSYIGVEVDTDDVILDLVGSQMSKQITAPLTNVSTHGGMFEVALVDGESGQVLWLSSNMQVAKPGQPRQDWEIVIDKIMRDLEFKQTPEENPAYARVAK